MSDQPQGPLVDLARTIGAATGKIAAAVSSSAAPAHAKTNLWAAEYLGGGTFVFHKPKRQARKRRQQAVKNRTRGMR
jgi:Mor family transcriptional regulator